MATPSVVQATGRGRGPGYGRTGYASLTSGNGRGGAIVGGRGGGRALAGAAEKTATTSQARRCWSVGTRPIISGASGRRKSRPLRPTKHEKTLWAMLPGPNPTFRRQSMSTIERPEAKTDRRETERVFM